MVVVVIARRQWRSNHRFLWLLKHVPKRDPICRHLAACCQLWWQVAGWRRA
jgi:hypothetical protein